MTAIFSRHFLSARGELRSTVECCRTPLGHILEHTLGHTLGRTGLQLCNRSALQIERRLVCVCVSGRAITAKTTAVLGQC